MKDLAFVNVAFGDNRYLEQQARLNMSIQNIYPDAKIFSWTNEMPPGARSFKESLYGFKPHAVNYALSKGYHKIMFFDPACILMKPIDFYQSIVKDYGVLAAQDDNKLTNFCDDRSINQFYFTRDQIADWHLVGGSFYYFDFSLDLCDKIFEDWLACEEDGYFGSQFEQASGKLDHGHRNDEAIMALCLYKHGSKPLTGDVRYNCENKEIEIIAKRHFK